MEKPFEHSACFPHLCWPRVYLTPQQNAHRAALPRRGHGRDEVAGARGGAPPRRGPTSRSHRWALCRLDHAGEHSHWKARQGRLWLSFRVKTNHPKKWVDEHPNKFCDSWDFHQGYRVFTISSIRNTLAFFLKKKLHNFVFCHFRGPCGAGAG